MAIVSRDEIHTGRGGENSIANKKRARKHERVFRVCTDSPYDGDFEVCAVCPLLGSLHPVDGMAYLVSKKATNDPKSKRVWIVTCSYSSERPLSENPLNTPAVIEWGTDTAQVPFFKDKDGNAILNSAGDYYLSGLKDEVSYLTVTVTKNLGWVPQWILDYRDAVNSDNVTIDGVSVAAGMAKIKGLHIGKVQYQENVAFRELQLTIKIKDDWKHHELDQGIYCLRDVGVTAPWIIHTRCQDNKGLLATTPQLLDGSGYQLPLPLSDPSAAVFNTHDLRKTKAFSMLPLN